MKNININYRKNVIEITSAFAKKASRYGSKEYEDTCKIRIKGMRRTFLLD